MARLVIQDSDHDRCLSLAATLKDRLSQMAGEGVEIRGPVACVIARIASRFRRQIELLADTPADLHHLLAKARHQGLFAAGERVTIDVDPMSLM
jgi:primosomal protein N'